MSEETLYTEDQMKEYGEEIIRQYSQEKSNLHSFLTRVIQNPDTLKTGNLGTEELGEPQLTIRGTKELELFSKDVCNDNPWAEYFNKLSEIQTASSLSKEGFLMRISVTQKKELADVTPQKKVNKGWFRKKEENSQQ